MDFENKGIHNTPDETLSRQTLSRQTTLSRRFLRFFWRDNVSPSV